MSSPSIDHQAGQHWHVSSFVLLHFLSRDRLLIKRKVRQLLPAAFREFFTLFYAFFLVDGLEQAKTQNPSYH